VIEKLDMDKLQKLVYYINNVKMSGPQREQLNRVIVSGILRGEIDTESLYIASESPETASIDRFLLSDALRIAEDVQGQWIQANVLYGKYDRWCGVNGTIPESPTVFGRRLKDMDIPFKKKADGNYYMIDPSVISAKEDDRHDS
jgi:hypothetical protein